ncbi:MAG: DUF1588 domain-containing protein, partial [Myxococcales bacterium]|nr:DUF1588 domain-containing protein [Myxococcales bacterium]
GGRRRALVCAAALSIVGLAACDGGEAARPSSASTQAFGEARLRRLSPREIRASVAELTGGSVDGALLADRTDAVGFDNGPASLDVAFEDAKAITLFVEHAVREASRRRPAWLSPACPSGAIDACRDASLGFVARAFRRALSAGERATFSSLFDARVVEGDAPASAADTVAVAALVHPGFLYREELGTPEGAVLRLAPDEIASSLAYLTTGAPPDATLTALAREGRLAEPWTRHREALRLIASPAGRATLGVFVRDWLGLANISKVTKDPKVYAQYTPELGAEMRDDAARTIDDVLAGPGSLEALLTTTAAYPGRRLASLYGVAYSGAPSRVSLDPSRAGLLTRAAFLTTHASSDSSGPISRGLAVRAALLCASLPAPPPGVSRVVPVLPSKTTRERFSAHTSDPKCQGCHERIDGVGFVFEGFDGEGRARTHEGAAKVDTSGTLFDADVADGPVSGVPELERRLLTSQALRTCFVRHALRFAFGSAEGPEDVALVEALASRARVTEPIGETFAAIAAHEAFVTRRAR